MAKSMMYRNNDDCAIHGYEPIPTIFHKICPECFHVFVEPEELLTEHNKRCEEVGAPPETDVNQVFICPMCTHDF